MVEPIDIETSSAVELVLELMAIPGPPGEEREVAERIVGHLKRAGVKASQIAFDQAHKRSPFGGNTGNLFVDLPGRGTQCRAPRIMLSTHMDTVPICLGSTPVFKSRNRVVAKGRKAGIGADNRSGCAALIATARELIRQKLDHPPVTLLFMVQEEIGLVGAHFADRKMLRKPAFAVNVDGGDPREICIGSIGGKKWKALIHGVPAHAGVHPEDGVSAASIFAIAHATLLKKGLHGKIVKGKRSGTANIGMLYGGEATNVVMDRLGITGECRSHNASFLNRLVGDYEKTLRDAARKVKNSSKTSGRIEFTLENEYPPSRVAKTSLPGRRVAGAMKRLGLTPTYKVVDGGVDAAFLNTVHRIPAVTIGAGAHSPHTVDEYLVVSEYINGCRLLLGVVAA